MDENYETPPATPERKPVSSAEKKIYKSYSHHSSNSSSTTSTRRSLGNAMSNNNSDYYNEALASISPSYSKSSYLDQMRMEDEKEAADIVNMYKGLKLSKENIEINMPGSHQKLAMKELEDHVDNSTYVMPHINAISSIFEFPSKVGNTLDAYDKCLTIAKNPENKYLLTTAIPDVTRAILNKLYVSSTETPKIIEFFQHIIAISLGLLKGDNKNFSLNNTLSRIFDSERRFYTSSLSSYTSSSPYFRNSKSNKIFSSPSSTAKKKNSHGILQPPDIFDENIDIDELSVNLKETKIAAEEKTDNGLEISEKDFLSDIIDDDSSNCNEKGKEEEEGKNGSNENDLKIFASVENKLFTPQELVNNVNYFGNLGGFELLLETIQVLGKDGSFNQLAQAVEPLVRLREVLNSEVFTGIVPALFTAINERVTKLSNSDIRVIEVDDVLQLVEQLNLIMFKTVDEREVRKETTPLEILVALRFMQCERLEKRLAGLNHITQKVIKTSLYAKEKGEGDLVSSNNNKSSAGYLAKTPPRYGRYGQPPLSIGRRTFTDTGTPPSQMVSFLIENKVIEELFGDHMHTELINRSHDILRFLSSNNAMTDTQLDAIWNASIGQHVSVVKAVHRSILAISQDISPTLLSHLMDICKEIKEMDSNTIEFFVYLVHHSGNSRLVLSSVLNILWNFLFEENVNNKKKGGKDNVDTNNTNYSLDDLTDEIVEEIEMRIVELLGRQASQELGLPIAYCKLCVKQLKNGTLVLRSLKLIQKVIETSDYAVALLEALEDNDGILSLLVDDLARYQRSAVKVALEYSPNGTELPVSVKTDYGHALLEAILVGNTNHGESLFERLKTLLFVLQNSSSNIRLEVEATKALWETAVKCAVTSRDLTLLMEFFVHAIDLEDDEKRYIDKSSADFVFAQLNSEAIPYNKYDLFTTKCFMTYFRFQNIHLGRLTTESCQTYFGRVDRLLPKNLRQNEEEEQSRNSEILYRDWRVSPALAPYGMETLWKILRQVNDKAVVDYIVTVLNVMHLEPAALRVGYDNEIRASERNECIKLLRNSYVKSCIQQYRYGEEMINSDKTLALRCFELTSIVLREYINEAQKHYLHTVNIGLFNDIDDLSSSNISASSSNHNDENKTDGANAEENIRNMGDESKSTAPGRKLSRIPSFGTPTSRSMDGQKQRLASLPILETERLKPSSILAQEDNFNVLFNFLDLDLNLARPVFALLESIPVNKQVFGDILELCHSNGLTPFLPLDGTFRAMYSLRIIGEILVQGNNSSKEDDSDEDENFLDESSICNSVEYGYLSMEQRILWTMQFSAKGGIEILVNLLKKCGGSIRSAANNSLLSSHYMEFSRKIITGLRHIVKIMKVADSHAGTVMVSSASKGAAFYAWRQLLDSKNNTHGNQEGSARGQNIRRTILNEMQSSAVVDGIVSLLLATINSMRVENNNANYWNLKCTAVHRYAISKSFSLLEELYEENEAAFIESFKNRINDWHIIIEAILLQTSSTNTATEIRSNVFRSLQAICNNSVEKSNDTVLNILFECFSKLLPKACGISEEVRSKNDSSTRFLYEYFLVFSVIAKSFPVKDDKASDKLFTLLEFTVDCIEQLETRETTVEFPDERGIRCKSTTDYTLVGLLLLSSWIIKERPTISIKSCVDLNLGKKILKGWLYPSNKSRSPKCKSEFSRKNAFVALTNLASAILAYREYHNIFLEDIAIPLSEIMIVDQGMGVGGKSVQTQLDSYELEGRSGTGFVGLRNPGCICYMNSLMQQLFMTVDFREGILNTDINSVATIVEDKKESVLYQLQTVFAKLFYTHRKAFPLSDFCHAYKDFDGNPTNVYIQQDADEFLRVFFDRLMSTLKGSNQEKRVASCFGGKVVNQIICQNVPYVSEREEDCPFLTVDIKGKSHILDALTSYVEGELLAGENAYYCEKFDRKVPAIKRICIRDLPNTLILHLKRFEFNFDAMCQMKVNDYCEFPLNLNMYPFTEEGLAEKKDGTNVLTSVTGTGNEGAKPKDEEKAEDTSNPNKKCTKKDDEYYEYELVGVVIHAGTTDSGHYYSLVRDRDVSNGARWYKFNDDTVSEFDLREMQDECFGGDETVYGNENGGRARYREKTRNAYMLFYQRKKFFDVSDDKIGKAKQEQTSKTKKMEEKRKDEEDGNTSIESDETNSLSIDVSSIKKNEAAKKSTSNTTVSPRSLAAIKALSNAIIEEGLNTDTDLPMGLSGPNSILSKIKNDNLRLMENQLMNDQNSFHYMLQILQNLTLSIDPRPVVPAQILSYQDRDKDKKGVVNKLFDLSAAPSLDQWTIRFLTTYFFNTIAPTLSKKVAYDEDAMVYLKRFVQVLEEAFRRLPNNTIYLIAKIQKSPHWISKWLLACPDSNFRDVVAKFLSNSIFSFVNSCEESEMVDDDYILLFYDSVVNAFARILSDGYPARYCDNIRQYFVVLKCLAKKGVLARYAFNGSVGMIKKLIDFILWENSPLIYGTSVRRTPMRTSSNREEPDFRDAVDFLSILIRSCRRVMVEEEDEKQIESSEDIKDDLKGTENDQDAAEKEDRARATKLQKRLPPSTLPKGTDADLVPPYQAVDCILFENVGFLRTLISLNSVASRDIILHLSFSNIQFSGKICRVILDGARRLPIDQLPQLWTLTRRLFCLRDEIQEQRIHLLLNPENGLTYLAKSLKDADFARSYAMIKAVASWSNGKSDLLEGVAAYLAKDIEQLTWIKLWLKKIAKMEQSNIYKRTSPSRGVPNAPSARARMFTPPGPRGNRSDSRNGAPFSP